MICVQPPLARLPGAELSAEYRYQDALISRPSKRPRVGQAVAKKGRSAPLRPILP
jgi:hypothetical protein